MANQRMFLRCKACGSERMIAKRMLDAYYTVLGNKMADTFDKWFEEHKWGFCDPEGNPHSLDNFELSFEHVDENGRPSGA